MKAHSPTLGRSLLDIASSAVASSAGASSASASSVVASSADPLLMLLAALLLLFGELLEPFGGPVGVFQVSRPPRPLWLEPHLDLQRW